MTVGVIAALLAAFVAGSMVYVYRFRGQVRYDSLREYLRKGWPLFSPLNCLLYLFTERRGRRPIMDVDQFPELDVIRQNWQTIREEALALHESRVFDQTSDPNSSAYYDIGFRTFYKYGWSKYYLKWYGTRHRSALSSCPETLRILDQVPCVNGAMFSVLPVGSKLTRHADPMACSMRYHLGLATPNDSQCYINIDGMDYSWRDGDDLLFDETYLHYARNDAAADRLILMCDVERPTWIVGRIVNFFYKGLMRLTVVPNDERDKRGLANTIFARVSPTLANVRTLKTSNPARYQTIKYSVNATLGLVVSAAIVGTVYGLYSLADSVI
ncbi:beta-hydroxylase [Tamilnaduibacter salinus]|uniref:Beta-hydroxylase n=1 Tax=Tamilnaduibacter salinus TaxID=1484056 RepID=A0A2U1D0D9_9GAMM|nr:aspartyl/asparaginyl beta-hydroxylase domain-containing protein [Tamilnaduibacter salinus]PVY78421.1 beta-hydroxylase [Tamilnaduibacter salinus]